MTGGQQNTLKWCNLKTGLLFLVGLTVASWLGFYIGKNTGLFSQHHIIKVFVADTKGLAEGNLVSVSGKKVGVVKSETFTSRNDTNGVLLLLDVRDEYFSLVTKDAKATIKSLGVLGDKYVDISIGRSHEPLADGGWLELSVEPGMEELTSSAVSTMKNLSTLTEKINKGEGTLGKLITTNELNDKINSAVDNISALTNDMAHGHGVVPQLLNDGDLAKNLNATLGNLNELSAKLKGDGAAGKLLVGEPLLKHLDGFLVHADSLTTELNDPHGNLAKLTREDGLYRNIDSTIHSFRESVKSLDSLLVDLKKNPKRYINVSVF